MLLRSKHLRNYKGFRRCEPGTLEEVQNTYFLFYHNITFSIITGVKVNQENMQNLNFIERRFLSGLGLVETQVVW